MKRRTRPETALGPLSRRGFLAATGAVALTVTVSGCGGDDAKDSGAQAAGGGAGFPVTVKGKLGATTVKSAPKRVAACGYLRDIDLALALGAPLVLATPNAVFGGLAPWQKTDEPVKLVDSADGLPIEKIAGARPDLILASDDYQLAKDYAKLHRIAPTLGYRRGVGEDGWDEMAQRAGDALGRRERADRLVAKVRAQIKDVRAKHPEFEGKTFTFGPVGADGSVYTTSSKDDAAATFFNQLGLELPPHVTALPKSSTPGRSVISQERLDLLDADVVILTYDSEKTRKTFEAKDLFKKLKAVRRGSYIALDMPTAIALAFPSVLSIPYGLDTVVPKLADALKNGA